MVYMCYQKCLPLPFTLKYMQERKQSRTVNSVSCYLSDYSQILDLTPKELLSALTEYAKKYPMHNYVSWGGRLQIPIVIYDFLKFHCNSLFLGLWSHTSMAAVWTKI